MWLNSTEHLLCVFLQNIYLILIETGFFEVIKIKQTSQLKLAGLKSCNPDKFSSIFSLLNLFDSKIYI